MRRLLVFLWLMVLLATLIGCGTSNLFSGQTTLSERAKKLEEARVRQDLAKTATDNTAAREAAQEIINDASATTDEKNEAYKIKGQAILGEQGVAATELVSNILASVDAVSEGEDLESFQTIQAALPEVEVAQIKLAADSLIASNPVTEQEKTDTGMAAGLVATELVTSVFDKDGDGQIGDADFEDESLDEPEEIWAAWTLINSGEAGAFSTGEGTATYYINQSVANLEGTSLNADMIQTLREIQSGVEAINTLGQTAGAVSADDFQSNLINQ